MRRALAGCGKPGRLRGAAAGLPMGGGALPEDILRVPGPLNLHVVQVLVDFLWHISMRIITFVAQALSTARHPGGECITSLPTSNMGPH